MKAYIKFIIMLFSTAYIFNNAFAQTAGYQIRGVVADSASKKPLNYITINLKLNDSPLKATLTRQGGIFGFDGLKPATYQLTVVAVGYQPKSITINLKDRLQLLDTIQLTEQVTTLKQVTITADRPIIKQPADRIIYDLQADPESKGNNLLTMMRKVPFLSLDANDNLLLKGNASFKVLINGKPSGMVENNLKAVLQSMPASTIQSIEVITNPPAKYDAEGMAGVINIITNKSLGNGFKGTVSINESFPAGGPGIGTSFSARKGKFGATGYGGANLSRSPLTAYTNTRNSYGGNPATITQNGTDRSKNRNGYFGTELSYEVDSLNLISGQFNINGSHGDGQNDQSSLLNSLYGTDMGYNLHNTNNYNNNGFDAGVNYQKGFKADKTKLLTLSYRYSNYKNAQFNDIIIDNRLNFSTANYQQDNNTQNREQTLQADYVQQIKNLSIEGGVKGILRDNKSNFTYLSYNPANSSYEVNSGFSDLFNYSQNVFGAYNSYRYSAKSWSFSGGIRIEQTHINADFISSQSRLDQNYFNVIPNLAINKEFKNKSSLSLGFNQRIKRPNIRRLNPFVDRSNPNFEVSGNPNLRPVLNNNIQLGYNNAKKLAVTMALGYSFINNIDLRISTLDTTTNITRTTYQNTGKASRLGLDYNLSYPFTNQWNLSLNGNVEYFKLSGLVGNTVIKKDIVAGYLSASSGYRFNAGWRLNGNVTYRSRAITDLQGTSNAFVSTSLSANKEMVKNKLSFAAVLNNPLSKYRYSITNSFGPDFTQINRAQQYFRSVNLSLNYNFGKLKENVKMNKRGINNDDGAR